MAKVKVWNRNVHPHREMFKGEWIDIPAGGYVEMDWEEGIEFRGQFTGIKLLGDDTPDPKGFKMIVVDPPSEPIFKEAPLICHADGKQAVSREELATMLSQYAHMRAPGDPEAEAATVAPPGAPSYGDLVKRLAALEAQFGDRKKPGPKPGFLKKKEAVG